MNSNELIHEVKKLRLSASEVLILIEKSVTGDYVHTSLFRLREGMMFLGKVLQGLGEPNPYADGPTEAIADFAEEEDITKLTGLPINILGELRDKLQELISSPTWNQVLQYFTGMRQYVGPNRTNWMYASHGLMNFTAAKMWLGMAINDAVKIAKEETEKESEVKAEPEKKKEEVKTSETEVALDKKKKRLNTLKAIPKDKLTSQQKSEMKKLNNELGTDPAE